RLIRAELGYDRDTVSKKIRDGTTQKIPNLLIVGEREVQNSTVTLRRYGIEKQETLSIEALEHTLVDAIKQRSLELQLS
ncbi:MAG: His/Gly/Thr/Pro-type tRNA ligase C-terminal domain-containing protein, partial [Pseudomonadales bacterium]|nr:His/Gly/Thr/Pro-type tRNA ligase C-terminal domain-containing protein [Pseudomonadales bacterium]